MGASAAFTLANRLSELDRLAEEVERFGEANGFSARTIYQIRLALDELATNVISYGYADEDDHLIEVDMRYEGKTFCVRLSDDGVPFDPVAAKAPDLHSPMERRAIGGLGIHLVKKVMDSVRYERRAGRNLLEMVKTIE